jgi:hypothetical protein
MTSETPGCELTHDIEARGLTHAFHLSKRFCESCDRIDAFGESREDFFRFGFVVI